MRFIVKSIVLFTLFCSCTSDKSLVGKWECEGGNVSNVLYLYEDSTFEWIKEGTRYESKTVGTWAKSGKNI